VFANKIQTLVNWINAIEAQRSQQATPSLIGERDMIAVLIMDLPPEYNTEVMLIELDDKFKFENAVELLRSREQCLKINVSKSSSINSVQNATKERKYPPCNVCGKFGHSSQRCYLKDGRQGAGRWTTRKGSRTTKSQWAGIQNGGSTYFVFASKRK
jgi:hypothetical protein